jgi:hypothetical protein
VVGEYKVASAFGPQKLTAALQALHGSITCNVDSTQHIFPCINAFFSAPKPMHEYVIGRRSDGPLCRSRYDGVGVKRGYFR